MAQFVPFPTIPLENPNIRESIQTSPDMFGGQVAQAMQRFGSARSAGGEALVRAGATLGAIAADRNRQINDLHINDANTKAMQDVSKLYGDYSQLEGKAAVDGLEPFQQSLIDYRKELIESAPNEYAREKISNDSSGLIRQFFGYAGQHSANEQQKYFYASINNAATEYGNQAALAMNNPEDMKKFIQLGVDKKMEGARRQGLDEVASQNVAHQYIGTVISNIARGQIEGGDPFGAERLLNEWQNDMDAGSILEVKRALQGPLNTAKGNIIATKGAHPELQTNLIFPVSGSNAGMSFDRVPGSGGSLNSRNFGGKRPSGSFHTAVDIPAKVGDPVLSVMNGGIVVRAGVGQGYGNVVDVRYPDGTVHRLAHLRSINVKVGQKVSQGDVLGSAGFSGNADASFPHVHYEVIKGDYYNKTGGRPPGRAKDLDTLRAGRLDPRAYFSGNVSLGAGRGDMNVRLRNAFASVESRGGPNSGYGSLGVLTKDNDRAYGRYQVMGANIPAWTKEVLGKAMTPEEFLRSPQAQDAVFDAKISQFIRKYGSVEDAASVWFTGRPRSAASGAAKDALGTTGSVYVNKIMAALGGSGGAPVDNAMAPRNQAVSYVMQQTAGDPQLQAASLTQLSKIYEQWNNETMVNRQELNQNVPKLIDAAMDGQSDIKFPIDEIIYNFPADKARDIIQEINIAQQMGPLLSTLKFSSAETLGQVKLDLDSNRGPISDAIKSAGLSENDNFSIKQKARTKINDMIDKRQAQLNSDSAGYALQEPTVNAAAKEADGPGGFLKYVTATTAIQAQMGVPIPRVLTKQQAEQSVANITKVGANSYGELINLKKTSGDAWPLVHRDLVDIGKLPPEYQALLILDNPTDVQLMQRALQDSKGDSDAWDKMINQAGVNVTDGITSAISAGMDPYVQSILKSGATLQYAEAIVNAVNIFGLAKSFYNKDPSPAESALKAFVKGKYDYIQPGGARVRVDAYDRAAKNAEWLKDNLSVDNLKLPSGGDWIKNGYVANAKTRSIYITTEDETGMILATPDGSGGYKLIRGKNGLPVKINFYGEKPYENIDLASPSQVNFNSRMQSNGNPGVDAYKQTLIESGKFSPSEIQKLVSDFQTGVNATTPPAIETYRKTLTDSGQFKPEEIEEMVKNYEQLQK